VPSTATTPFKPTRSVWDLTPEAGKPERAAPGRTGIKNVLYCSLRLSMAGRLSSRNFPSWVQSTIQRLGHSGLGAPPRRGNCLCFHRRLCVRDRRTSDRPLAVRRDAHECHNRFRQLLLSPRSVLVHAIKDLKIALCGNEVQVASGSVVRVMVLRGGRDFPRRETLIERG
jgi:hypothetical protein